MSIPVDPQRIYAIGDVHGRLSLLRAVHERIEVDLKRRPAASHVVVHIGDFVDRGPDSAGVLDHLIAGLDRDAPWITLLGNHDRLFRSWLDDPDSRDLRLSNPLTWLHPRLGGLETLRSYPGLRDLSPTEVGARRAEIMRAVPGRHRMFLASLPSSWQSGPWFFTHAGVRPGTPLHMQTEDDLVWIRNVFLESRVDHGAVIVHGHTPVDEVEHHGNRIAIDTGAAFGGPLSCVVLEDEEARVLGGGPLAPQRGGLIGEALRLFRKRAD